MVSYFTMKAHLLSEKSQRNGYQIMTLTSREVRARGAGGFLLDAKLTMVLQLSKQIEHMPHYFDLSLISQPQYLIIDLSHIMRAAVEVLHPLEAAVLHYHHHYLQLHHARICYHSSHRNTCRQDQILHHHNEHRQVDGQLISILTLQYTASPQ
jgi:hypothetical protein